MDENITPAAVPEKASARREIYDWLQSIVSALLLCVLLFVFITRLVTVNGTSMVPTLHNNDRILISRLFYTPTAGDVVVLQTDNYGEELLVKRIIATEGQTVDIDFSAGIVYVDGVALDEPYVYEPTYERESFEGPLTIPEGYVFVMGDNRNHSLDSRSSQVGLVDARSVMGKVYLVLFPGQDDYGAREFSRIGGVK